MRHRIRTGAFALGLFAVCAHAGAQPSFTLPKIKDSVVGDANTARAAADLLEAGYAGKQPPEAMRMLIAILRDSRMGAGEGWFGPAQTRYTWKWLAEANGVDPSLNAVTRKAFKGTDLQFARLDRDRDGVLTPDDLDWSDASPYLRQSAIVRGWFRKMNTEGGGSLTKKEWDAFFDAAAKGKDTLSADDLLDAIVQGNTRRTPKVDSSKGGVPKASPEFRTTLVRGLFANEIGSMNEGPGVGQPAPDFSLKTIDGKDTVRLSNLVGKKPLVLVFGNFTCGPFCRSYPSVEPVARRFKDEATFAMVYVREAHPSDGWGMGEEIKQPRTYEDRVAVARKFVKLTSPTIPVLVDEMNDPAGHAYSGMPSRLYVIDAKGKVAFKSGRGPHGFRIEEMEQALAMSLLEATSAK